VARAPDARANSREPDTISCLLRSIADLTYLVAVLDEPGYGSLIAELRRKQAERPTITGVPRIDPERWWRGSI
jgi:hypothetical protein